MERGFVIDRSHAQIFVGRWLPERHTVILDVDQDAR
jgi:hypothetical protein